LRLKHPFVHASWSGQDAVFVKPDGDVAFASHDEAAVVHPLPRGTNLAAVLVFAFFVGGPERVCVHGALFFLARNAIKAISLPPSKVNQ
jgi:hypothetical protein